MTHNKSITNGDHKQILRAIGTPVEISLMLVENKSMANAIGNWVYKNTIPPAWKPAVAAIAVARKIALPPDFLAPPRRAPRKKRSAGPDVFGTDLINDQDSAEA